MEQHRVLVAILVSFVFVFAYKALVLDRYKPVRHEPPSAPVTPTAPATSPVPAAPSGELAALPGDEAVVVDTDVLRVRITPTGARLAGVELKAYRRTVARDSPPLDLVESGPLLSGTLQLEDGKSDAALVYRPDKTSLALRGDERGEITFVADGDGGRRVEKRYAFSGDGYLFELNAGLSGGRPPETVGLILAPLAAEPEARGPSQAAVAFAIHRLQETAFKSLKPDTHVPTASWAGFAAHYFMFAAMPATGTTTALLTLSGDVPIVRVDGPVIDGEAKFAIYTGPKERDVLARAGHDLDRALDFGWFWFVAIPFLSALRWLHRITGNYGIAIIVLTAVAKAVTWPLTQTTFRNMREMQKIQPQMAKLRERLKNDQVALQKEMMELYRRHRVNPLSGCVPMLLQLPILYGLYSALSRSIELRHAPFALWINDLSAPDRLVIPGIPGTLPLIGAGVPVLTLLMGASMFLQQWLSPQQGDPTQQRMMMFMPLMFTFMFINFPAGLVLYWLVNNLLTIGQQYFMMRSAK